MVVSQLMELYPQTKDILAEYGLHCFSCAFNALETLEEGCLAHGFDERDLENLLQDVNEIIMTLPKKPQTITVTETAARAILAIMKRERKIDHVLEVIADESGSFCMEFRELAPPDTSTFHHRSVSNVTVCASCQTLSRIGGATIDFRDERFKLDLK